jgi:hypothetical protein
MKNNLFLVGIAGLSLLAGAGCETTQADKPAATPKPAKVETKKAEAAKAPKVSVPVPADSPFAKIKVGMGMKEVADLIGQPTDTSAHVTGKAFIPYYYGGDTHRVESLYKGQGRIVFAPAHAFSGDLRVIEINYNASERGYN